MTAATSPSPSPGRRYELVGQKQGRLVPLAVPTPGPAQVLVRVRLNGICASDLPTWAQPQPSYPLPLGHEAVGIVIAAGAGADLPPGSRVTGRFTPALADFVLADQRDLVVVPHEVATQHALGEPLGCVAEAVRRAPPRQGDRVAVIGLGFMGLVMVQMMAAGSTSRVAAIDLRPDARAVASRTGADEVHHPDDVEPLSHDSFDLVVEATGSQAGLDLATRLVRPHGTLSILGYHQSARLVDVQAWNWKAIDVANTHVRDRDLLREATRRGLALLAAGRINLEPLVTHVFPLDRVDDAFRALEEKPAGFVKAVVEVST